MAQRRDDVEYDTKHDVALSATISTPVLAAIHHRTVGAKSMFATESVHSQMVAVANYRCRCRRRLHVWGYRATRIGHQGADLKICAVNGDRMNPIARRHRVVDHIVERLAAIGVDYVFGVDGANIEDLYDAAYFRSDLTAILAKHEFSAATMADGYSRSGAGLGVVCATSGGGCLNTVAGLGESLASRVPVLALIGQAPTSLDGRGAFQDTSGRNGALNGEALFSVVSVYCRRVVNPADIVSALPEAIAAAKTGGPAVLLLPKNVQQSKIELNNSGQLLKRLIGDPYPVAQALRRAEGPVTIIAGEQVARDDARAELEQLRAALRARVATVPDAKDVAGTPGLGSSSALGVTGVMG
ncbi:MAG: acetolactate synthase large subunit, partial [Mycobacterium sp.]|nr:acetolactate synthase large subunit [Mycobacterium sp.]